MISPVQKKLSIIALFIFVLLMGTIVVLKMSSDEDTWLCQNGEWVKHGNPTAAKPTFGCDDVKQYAINSFTECVKAGYPVMESYPQRCTVTEEDRVFIEDIGNELDLQDVIISNYPRPNGAVENPIPIKGEARGSWFFEGSFMITLQDSETQKILGTAVATSTGDWTTEEFIPFTASLTFSETQSSMGLLIFEKSNPSGLAKNAMNLFVPVLLAFEE